MHAVLFLGLHHWHEQDADGESKESAAHIYLHGAMMLALAPVMQQD